MRAPKLIELPKILDSRGNLSFFENGTQVPFDIRRTYWIYDVPERELRGGHAFKESNELIIALSGSFTVTLHNGTNESKYFLNRSYYGLFIPKMYWRSLGDFSTNSLALIVSSIPYNDKDYIKDFSDFKRIRNEKNYCF